MSNVNLISLVHFNEINTLLQPLDECNNTWFTTNTANSSNIITINDILSLEAKFGSFSYKFTDVDNKYYCLTTSNIDVNEFVQNNFTIEFWFKPDMNNLSISGADIFSIGHRYDNSGEDLFTGLRVSVFYKGIKFTVDQDYITKDKIYVYNVEFDFDTWYHLALTKENDVLRFFVDGNIVAAIKYDQEELADLLNSEENKLAFGYIYNDNSHNRFVGAIDEVRILDQAIYTRINFIPSIVSYIDTENRSTIGITNNMPDYLSLLHFNNNDDDEDSLYSPYDIVTKSNWLYDSGEDHVEGINLSNIDPKFGDSCYRFFNNMISYYMDTDTSVENLNPVWLYYNPNGFTVDFWIRLEEDTAGNVLGFYTDYTNGFTFDINEDGALVIKCGNKEFIYELTAYDWHHIAISKVEEVIYIFIDGIEVNTINDWDLLFDPLTSSNPINYKGQTFIIGSYTDPMNTKTFTGSIDEFRILNKGIYMGNFEVPTEESKMINTEPDSGEDTTPEDTTPDDTTGEDTTPEDITVYTDTCRKIKSPYERDFFYLTFNIPNNVIIDDVNNTINHDDDTTSSDNPSSDDSTSTEPVHVPRVDEGVTFVKVDSNKYAEKHGLGYAFTWLTKTED